MRAPRDTAMPKESSAPEDRLEEVGGEDVEGEQQEGEGIGPERIAGAMARTSGEGAIKTFTKARGAAQTAAVQAMPKQIEAVTARRRSCRMRE